MIGRRLGCGILSTSFAACHGERERERAADWPRAPFLVARKCQYVNFPTMVRRSAAIRDSSSTAVRVWPRAWVVESAAVETPVMLVAISVVPVAASCTDLDIS